MKLVEDRREAGALAEAFMEGARKERAPVGGVQEQVKRKTVMTKIVRVIHGVGVRAEQTPETEIQEQQVPETALSHQHGPAPTEGVHKQRPLEIILGHQRRTTPMRGVQE